MCTDCSTEGGGALPPDDAVERAFDTIDKDACGLDMNNILENYSSVCS